ncbi:MAG TPA: hypothetical protein VMM59_04745 [Thermohalobaculum sp.]|nr:hypothetical protein [Thermohalobaculum sp.]
MRRYDLLDEYATVIAPRLAPRARSRPHPAGRPKVWPVPALLLVLGIVLLAVI